MNKKTTNINFDVKLKRLEEISSLLEEENIGLEDSIKLFEEGVLLSKECQEALNKAELKITELKNSLSGSSDELELDN